LNLSEEPKGSDLTDRALGDFAKADIERRWKIFSLVGEKKYLEAF